MPIKVMFYAEFDDDLGPRLVHQHPPDVALVDMRDVVSLYIIPNPAFGSRLIVFRAEHTTFMGYPISVPGPYRRNFLTFNVVLGFDNTADVRPYRKAVRKIAVSLSRLEVEVGYLFKQQQLRHEEAAVEASGLYSVPRLLRKLFADLNAHQEAVISINPATILSVKLLRPFPVPPRVGQHEVPIPVVDLQKEKGAEWDLVLTKVVAWLDGARTVRSIAEAAGMGVATACEAVRHLVHYECVRLVDAFQFANMYSPTSRISDFAPHTVEDALRREACAFVQGSQAGVAVTYEDLLAFFAHQGHGKSVADTLPRTEHNIDPRRAVCFGVLHGVLERLHEWPFVASTEDAERIRREVPELAKYVDGSHCADEACCALQWSRAKLHKYLQQFDSYVAFVHT